TLLWLERSKESLLDVEIFFNRWNIWCDLEFHVGEERIDLILPHAHRWRSLKLTTEYYPELARAIHMFPPNLPSLTTLSLHCLTPSLGREPYPISVGCPNLRHLEVRGMAFDFSAFPDMKHVRHLTANLREPEQYQGLTSLSFTSLVRL